MKELRLRALRDPVADLAYLETYEEAAARPDSYWQERAARGAEGAAGAQQVVAVGPGGGRDAAAGLLGKGRTGKAWSG